MALDEPSLFFLSHAWVVPLAPFVAFLLILWMRNGLRYRGQELALPAVALSFLWSVGMAWEYFQIDPTARATHLEYHWLTIGPDTIEIGLLVDNLSLFLALLVSFLSFLIVLYSVAYMHEEGDRRPRYYAEMTLFIAGMLGTVLSGDYLLMFISWEMMGLCSYLLIGYWFERPSAASAAKKAFLVTRLGDISLLLGMLILWTHFHTFNYQELFEAAKNPDFLAANANTLLIANLAIFGGAVGKSAQFPLHVWLPDAMEGPTTVSALIHAATMVKAGVFLVARSFPLMVHTPDVFLVIAVLGAVTALMAATIALVQWDIKRVLAYSTLSQLGYMFLALGAGGLLAVHLGSSAGYTSGLFHLMNHAFFKALLFLAAGSVILGMHHHQDMRKMGGLHKRMPVTSVTMLLASLSIAGLPPFSGFWSKDEVLATVREASQENPIFTVLWLVGLLTALLTAFYMFRMWFLTFAGKSRSPEAEHAHESPAVMTGPLAILAVFAVVGGFFLFSGLSEFLHFDANEFVSEAPVQAAHGGFALLTTIVMNPLTYLSVALAAAGTWFAYRVYIRHRPHPDALIASLAAHDAHKVLTNLYYYDRAFMGAGQGVGLGLARASDWCDRWIVDGTVRGVAWVSRGAGRLAGRSQTGNVTNYAVTVIVGFTLVLISLLWVLARSGGV